MMIPRYTNQVMAEVWTEQAKFDQWVQSLIAVIHARVVKDEVDQATLDLIRHAVSVDVPRVHELDSIFRHDAGALIETAKESLRAASLNESVIALLGAKITSYDMEDPAFGIMIIRALDLVLTEIDNLIVTIKARALEFRQTLCIFITHGQPAVPGYLGLRFCRWIAMLERDKKRILASRDIIRVGKFSGAGGTYDELDPDIEQIACSYLELEVDGCSSQIIHRDRHAQVMTALAICACNISQIANDLWLMCAYPRNEAKEYFSPTQRGSTAMPHKKNPVNVEKLRGLSSPMRGYALNALEHIMTYDERAIDQSSTERIIWPDATILLHYMLTTMIFHIQKTIFFQERMRTNLDVLQSIWAAQYIKNALWDKGVFELGFTSQGGEHDLQPTYKWVQSCAFIAWDQEINQPVKPLRDVLVEQGVLDHLSQEELDRCFDLNWVLRNADAIYARFGIS